MRLNILVDELFRIYLFEGGNLCENFIEDGLFGVKGEAAVKRPNIKREIHCPPTD